MSHYAFVPGNVLSLRPSRHHVARAAGLFVLLVVVVLLGASAMRIRAATTISFTGEELLGKPEDTSITVNIVPGSTIEYFYDYGTVSGTYPYSTTLTTATGGQPSEVVISGLTPNTQYFYRMRYHLPGETDWVERTEHSFWTQRAQGSTFVFTVTSDAHANAGSTAMTNIYNEDPDFNIDLGDTFMVDNAASETQDAVNTKYLSFREPTYFDKIGCTVPIFLSSGNHEEEEGWNLDDTPSRALLSIQARKAFYPTPIDDGFYSGNTDPLAAISETLYGDEYREDYYAWTWGDALFVVIDPFQYTMNLSYSPTAGEENDETVTGDQWNWTLGAQQYNWLKETLENSNAKYKFMFSHQMVGGVPRAISGVGAGYVRGGAEAAAYFEWGGDNADGSDGFGAHRNLTDFPETIEELMEENGVSAYFHGHDHQYVYERRPVGGIVFQEVPSPSMTGSGFSGIYTVGTYSEYETIAMCPGSGHLKITITPELATVEYVKSGGTGSCNPTGFSLSYTITPTITGPTHVLTTTVSPGGAGTISPSAGTHTYAEGTVVTVTASANTGYAFSSWSGACTGSGTCAVTMNADKSVTANFSALPSYNLTMAVSPSGAGTTNPAVGAHSYYAGTVVTVTTSANTGYAFSSWSGACSGSGSCVVTMNATKAVTANFTSLPTHNLTVAVSPTGGGTTNPTAGVHTYNAGTVVPVTATPATGYAFSSWSGACTGSGSCSVTMDASKTVTATFVTNGVTSAATPSNPTPSIGQQVVVSINIDMSGAASPDNQLGSFTGSLAWDPAILTYNSNSGLLAGFSGAVNTANVGTGTINFNGANATGATGNNVVLQITFDVVGLGTSALNLEYSAMAAAYTFTDLQPVLAVTDGQVVVSSTHLGDVNGDGLVNSTDALIILSADVGMNTSAYCPMNCGDVNGNGLVNSTDALIILSYDVGMSVPYPLGTGACPSSITQPPGCS